MRLNPDRMRLLASIGFNIVAKLPSIVSLLLILPMISQSLGPNLYGQFLAMLALGSTFTLFFGGINTVGRRRLSFAYTAGDTSEQSVAVSDTIWLAAICALIAGSMVFVAANQTAADPSLIVIALIPIIAAFTNTFDNLRAAYNEHYITAILQTITQSAIYSVVFLFGLPLAAVVLAAFVLTAPYILASAFGFVGLLWGRRYLQLRAPKHLASNFQAATYVTLADGAVFSALNASLYGLSLFGATEAAGWYGTLMRAFQTLLTPALLILLPLTSFVALRWANWTPASKRRALNVFVSIALLYGCFVGLCFVVAGNYYLARFFPEIPRPPFLTLSCVSVFFGAIVAQKIYVQLIYSVYEARRLSFGIFFAICAALGLAAVSGVWLDPLDVLEVFCLATSAPLVTAIFIDQMARRSALGPTLKVITLPE